MDLFEQKGILPMLIGSIGAAFDDPSWIYELKWDGTRCLAYIDPHRGIHLENKRHKILTPGFPELGEIHRQVSARCILDGELFVLNGGKVDFPELQRRSLLSHPLKIQLAAARLPATFTAFDILYLDGEDLTLRPLMERKEKLKQAVARETDRFAMARYIEEKGTALYRAAEQEGLEGIVAKRKDSLYLRGKRTKDWIKCKNLRDDDFVVCGFYFKADNLVSVILGSYHGNYLLYQGHVVIAASREDYRVISRAPAAMKSEHCEGFPEFEEAVWLQPSLVCRVEFMDRTARGGLRQPVFRGLRDDKAPEECRAVE